MSIQEIHASTLKEAFGALEELVSLDGAIFRGHSSVEWRLSSTLARDSRPDSGEDAEARIEDLLRHFFESLASVGKLPSSDVIKSRRGRLEYGRHHGVPSPLIDFTYSPYVAVFFAFNGISSHDPEDEVVVYALSIDDLAIQWASRNGPFDPEERKLFLDGSGRPVFGDSYPSGALQFVGSPASWNTRMQRQLGAFLYDTVDHADVDLESYIEQIAELAGAENPALTKVFIRKSLASQIFQRLELMGMTGVRLLDDYVGAAADVYNGRHYLRVIHTWDLAMPPPSGKKT